MNILNSKLHSALSVKRGALLKIGLFMLVWALMTLVFILRNTASLHIANFYAEDGTIFYNNVLTENPIEASFTPFNGYLVVGQYGVAYVALLLSYLTGGDLVDLAKWSAIVSCLFLGLVVSLPLMLFRKHLGTILALITVVLCALVPMLNFDYAIIGTLGNLKFAFLFVAFLLILYRIVEKPRGAKLLAIDLSLIICVATNVTALFLLPAALYPYRHALLQAIREKTLKKVFTYDLISLGSVLVLSAAYVSVCYMRGIPSMPGYLDSPYNLDATIPLLNRSTVFALLYPLNATLTDVVVLLLIGILALVCKFAVRGSDRMVVLFSLWSIFIASALFIYNRPGTSEAFLDYANKGGFDQFFYAQNMIFIFLIAWVLRKWFNRQERPVMLIILLGLATYIIWALPYGTSFGGSKVVYQGMGTIEKNIAKACAASSNKRFAVIQLYPTTSWQWTIERSKVC